MNGRPVSNCLYNAVISERQCLINQEHRKEMGWYPCQDCEEGKRVKVAWPDPEQLPPGINRKKEEVQMDSIKKIVEADLVQTMAEEADKSHRQFEKDVVHVPPGMSRAVARALGIIPPDPQWKICPTCGGEGRIKPSAQLHTGRN